MRIDLKPSCLYRLIAALVYGSAVTALLYLPVVPRARLIGWILLGTGGIYSLYRRYHQPETVMTCPARTMILIARTHSCKVSIQPGTMITAFYIALHYRTRAGTRGYALVMRDQFNSEAEWRHLCRWLYHSQ